jgi:carbon monoxide dehydrogenase subunit G
VGSCGPGVESIDVVDATHFRATARVGVGGIQARFVVDMEMAEQEPPERAVIKAKGHAPGSAVDATAEMQLSDGGVPGTTAMAWTADVAVHGHLMAVGARLIEGTANRMIAETFDCIRSKLQG